jgi:peptidyl-prolyl cis-trans isomerase SurA
MKRLISVLILLNIVSQAGAQTLFTYGSHAVGRDEFLRAFHKNNPDTGEYRRQVTEYLELYTRFRLKVQWAYDARLDTLPQQLADADGFKREVQQSFLTDSAVFNRLAEEAWERSKTDIRLAHIYVPFRQAQATEVSEDYVPNRQDSLRAMAVVRKVQDDLRAGKSFESVAMTYSADPDVQTLKGEIGYVTAFTLPYAIENLVYALKDQQVSEPIATISGYHIFKKLGQRPARGKLRIAQILVAFDAAQGTAARERARKLADSLYRAIRNGSDFSSLAERFSNDQSSYAHGGVLPEFGVGKYHPVFEAQAYALRDSGDVCPPFETPFGFHLLQKRGEVPVEQDREAGLSQTRVLVLGDERNGRAIDQFERNAVTRSGYRRMKYAEQDLWKMTDTLLLSGKEILAGSLKMNTTLFVLSDQKVTVSDWLIHARDEAIKPDRGSYPAQMEAYVRKRAVEYYRMHLEELSPAFAAQMKEFRDGNLLFESMERQVWNKSAADTAGLRRYYLSNADKYQWGPSADLILVHAVNQEAAEEAKKAILARPGTWESLASQTSGRMMADSGRFELTQFTDIPAGEMRAGNCTAIRSAGPDGTRSFLYVVRLYPGPMQRSFDQAKGQVMADYQQMLEDQWISELKKKYPVQLNKAEWSRVLNR